MAVLVYAENKEGKFKKPTFEACTYGYDLAQSLGMPCMAVSVGKVADADLKNLGKYGVSKVFNVQHDKLAAFGEASYASAVAEVAQKAGAHIVVLAQTYNGRAIGPRLSVKLGAAFLSGVTSLLAKAGNGYQAKRMAYTSKAIEELGTSRDKVIVSVKGNSYKVKESSVDAAIEAAAYTPNDKDFVLVSKEIKKASDKVSLTEAEIVVSAGRGIGGDEGTFAKNWQSIGELADMIGAATACSKPIGDLHWRPHHEHVGQTGVQISPNVYIAVGISGAIQHLAGVSSSKTIIVINKDAEAPFFKAADYGIVADAMDVLPKLNAAIKAYKAKQ